MSQLSQLKSAIDGVAKSTSTTARSLAQFKQQFGQQSQQVQNLIGGSAQRKDQEVVTAIQQASKAVEQASAALERAAKVAQSYGQSL